MYDQLSCRLYIKYDDFNWNVTKRKQLECSCQLDCTPQISDSYSNISDLVELGTQQSIFVFGKRKKFFGTLSTATLYRVVCVRLRLYNLRSC